MAKFYITTTLPYVNAEPHVGFALEIIQADVIARYHQLMGDEVFFNFGTDEHGQKIWKKANEQNRDPKEYCDEMVKKFDDLKQALNLSYNNFIRTTDSHHLKAAQAFWRLCFEKGDIYKKNYVIKYCVGCELEKTDSELIDGKCQFHPNQELEIRNEENYFFKFSKYQKPLLEFYNQNPHFVIPEGKYTEIKVFVENGLSDFSVSRLKSKMPWGIPVPNDPDHVMYVWFDALINYISALNWPEDEDKFESFWPGIQVAGKDNLRQQTAMWQAMLMSAGLPNSKQVYIHGFITVNGQKMSKSLGDTINPIELSAKYGTDAVRYYLLSKIDPYEDSDFTYAKFEEIYNADLANGLGNLVSRIFSMCFAENLEFNYSALPISEEVYGYLKEYKYNEYTSFIWNKIKRCDQTINEKKLWEIKGKEKLMILNDLLNALNQIATDLLPILPETANKIICCLKTGKIIKTEPLFPRNL